MNNQACLPPAWQTRETNKKPGHLSSVERAKIARGKMLWEVKRKVIGPVWERPRTRKGAMVVMMFGLGLRWCRHGNTSRGQGAKSRCKGTEVSSSEGPKNRSEEPPANGGNVEEAPNGPCCLL